MRRREDCPNDASCAPDAPCRDCVDASEAEDDQRAFLREELHGRGRHITHYTSGRDSIWR